MENIINPSDIIVNKLNEIGLSKVQLANLMGIKRETIMKKISRERPLDIEDIYKLGRITGIDVEYLAECEFHFREYEEKTEDYIDEYNEIIEVYHILEEKGLVPKTDDVINTVKNFRKFMEIGQYSKLNLYATFLSGYELTKLERLLILVWIQIGLRNIRKKDYSNIKTYDKSKINEVSNDIEKIDFGNMTNKKLKEELMKTLNGYGIILNFEPELQKGLMNHYITILSTGYLYIQIADYTSNLAIIEALKEAFNKMMKRGARRNK